MSVFSIILFTIIGYLLGAISFAVIIARSQGVDIFSEGSGNPGATNVKRILGKKWGHTDQSSKIIKNLDKNLSELLNKFRYQNNLAYLHFDQSLMPKNKLIWSSWNYSTNSQKQISCITYWMNRLQNLDIDKNIFVTLNPIQIPKENKIIKIFKYEHPIYDKNSLLVQKQIKLYQGKNNIFFAGAWNGFGFHEDGVKSALNIANKLKVDLSWIEKNEKSN